MPVVIPPGVEVELSGGMLTVKGPKGQLSRELHPEMQVEVVGGEIIVNRPSDNKRHKSLHGLTRTLVANMVEGVVKGYQKNLVISGVGYRAAKQGEKLVLTVGYSHPVEIAEADGVEFEVPAPNKIIVKGADKQKVGAMAAKVRATRPPEPYKGKGIKYENERIIRKEGKTGA